MKLGRRTKVKIGGNEEVNSTLASRASEHTIKALEEYLAVEDAHVSRLYVFAEFDGGDEKEPNALEISRGFHCAVCMAETLFSAAKDAIEEGGGGMQLFAIPAEELDRLRGSSRDKDGNPII